VGAYEDILEDARTNPAILGLILSGSRGKGFENAYSDYDLIMIAAGDAVATFRAKYAGARDIDLTVCSLAQFRDYAQWGSAEAWDRYTFAHVKVLVDKTGTLAGLAAEKGRIPPDKLAGAIDTAIDAYVNGVYRAVKCIRNGNALGARLEAANAMLDLLTLVFALNGRHRPFLGYLEKELSLYPLDELPWSVDAFAGAIARVLDSADLETQQMLLADTEKFCRARGHGHMFDSWSGKDRWTMTWRPQPA
jgi:hypothetical protein